MGAVVTVYDEMPNGKRLREVKLELASERITARELIERRVRQEVEHYNKALPAFFEGLVVPTDAEQTLNGCRVRKGKLIDADIQVEKALEAFENNGFFLLVDDLQIESLDHPIGVTSHTKVSFIKLVPLVGG